MYKRLVLAAAALCGAHAYADPDPKFEYGKAEEVAKVKGVEYSASAEAGVVFTTGNSETTTATGGFKIARKKAENKLAAEGSLTYAKAGVRVLRDQNGNGTIDSTAEIRTEKQVTAESMAAKLRYDRFLTAYNSLFIAGLASRDVPGGKELVLGVQVGYSRQIYKTKTAEAVAEIGLNYDNENLTSGKSIRFLSGRAFVGYKAEMTPGTAFEMSGELLTNLTEETLATNPDGGIGKDTRFNFKASVSSKLSKSLSFQTSLEAKYDNRPGPLNLKQLAMDFHPEASKLDTIMKASLIYTFL